VSTVAAVTPPAEGQLKPGDTIAKLRLRDVDSKTGQPKNEGWTEPWTDVGPDEWAWVAQQLKLPLLLDMQVQLKDHEAELTLVPHFDPTWPVSDRGLRLMPAARIQKADGILDALGLGMQDTTNSIRDIYASLVSMFSGRISVKNLGGPILIARAAYNIAGRDTWEFLFFLGLISVNLAVVNFLPIPLLDGGHMVFLLYESVRGKPASEQVKIGATYVGLAMILSLMAFVIYLDLTR
jgi:regulator of sigma E protease